MVVKLKPHQLNVFHANSKVNENIRIYKYWLAHPDLNNKQLASKFNRSETGITYLLSVHIKRYGFLNPKF